MVARAIPVQQVWSEIALHVRYAHSYDTGADAGMEPADAGVQRKKRGQAVAHPHSLRPGGVRSAQLGLHGIGVRVHAIGKSIQSCLDLGGL